MTKRVYKQKNVFLCFNKEFKLGNFTYFFTYF